MIDRVTYARLYILPDNKYENERFEAVAIVQNGDVEAAWNEARQCVETQYTRWLAERTPKPRAKQSDYVNEPPATTKQLSYIGRLQDNLCWTSEQLAAYAGNQGVDLVSMTMRQASAFIDGMRRLATESSAITPIRAGDGDIPF